MKPYEVEILVAQVGATIEDDSLFHILYDGTLMDEEGCTVLGGQADAIDEILQSQFRSGMHRDDAIKLGAAVLAGTDNPPLGADQLEVGVLDRAMARRAFGRVKGSTLDEVLAGTSSA